MYIAKYDTWFKAGTEVKLLEDYSDGEYKSGLFEGMYIVGSCNPTGYDTFWYEKGYVNGEEVVMREICSFDEFWKCELVE